MSVYLKSTSSNRQEHTCKRTQKLHTNAPPATRHRRRVQQPGQHLRQVSGLFVWLSWLCLPVSVWSCRTYSLPDSHRQLWSWTPFWLYCILSGAACAASTEVFIGSTWCSHFAVWARSDRTTGVRVQVPCRRSWVRDIWSEPVLCSGRGRTMNALVRPLPFNHSRNRNLFFRKNNFGNDASI